MSGPAEERVLVLAPPEEPPETSQLPEFEPELSVEQFPDLLQLSQALERGAAAVLLPASWVTSPGAELFVHLMEHQPVWSQLPVLLVASADDFPSGSSSIERLDCVTLLEPPLRRATLRLALRSALRSRRRQYEVRERLREQEAAEAALRASEERLRFSLDAGRLGFWEHSILTDELISSELCRAHFGRAPREGLSHEEILAVVHPDDRDRVREEIRRAVRAKEGYVLEYRVVWPDGSVHWLMVRGRATYDTAGRPVSTFGVTLDITRRKEAESLQAEQAEQLREAGRRKDEFLAMLAHELRNPLAPVTNALGIMRARPGRKQGERARRVVERQIDHMTRLIDDLLDVSRINSGKISLKRERLDLVEAVENAVESARGLVAQCGHTLEITLPIAPVYVEVDPVRLEQVIANLVNNAAKYTERGGRIAVTLDADAVVARLSIRDTGIGIAPDLLPQVFDLFTQGERGLDRSQGGLGLGLTLVRNLVRLHGGDVEARSEGPDRGSEFVVRLPIAGGRRPVVSGQPPERGEVRGARDEVALARPSADAPARHPNRIPEIREAGAPRILVVDDNRDSAETLAELAQLWGFESATAYEGITALQRADELVPGFVLLDIGMPGLSGYDVARRLRADPRFANATLVALTGYGKAEDMERSRAAGFNHHLVKPVDPTALQEVLLPGTACRKEAPAAPAVDVPPPPF